MPGRDAGEPPRNKGPSTSRASSAVQLARFGIIICRSTGALLGDGGRNGQPENVAPLRAVPAARGQEQPFISLLFLDTLGQVGRARMLNRLLASTVQNGTLTLIAPGGQRTRFGEGEPQIG